jgi:VWFA-related protein
MRRLPKVILAACGLAVPAAAGAEGQPVPSFPARAERVVVDVVVTDRDGVPVLGLSASDFEVSEDGERQRIASFEAIAPGSPVASGSPEPIAEAPTPPSPVAGPGRFYVVAFDDVNMTPFKVHQAKAAVASFVRSIGEDDRVLLVATGSGEGRLSESGTSRQDLLDMLGGLRAGYLPDMSPDRISDYEAMLIHVVRDTETLGRVQGRIASRTGGGRMSVEANAAETYARADGRTRDTLRALERLIETMTREKGRKSVILVSEGFILSPRIGEFRSVTQAAMRANAALYFVDARQMILGASEYPVEFNDLGNAGAVAKALADRAGEAFGSETLATDTGGFSIRNTNDLAGGMRRIAAETSSYYLVGYDPSKEPDGRFRKIRVKVSRKGVRVRARKGYVAEKPPAPAPPGR